MPKAKGGKSPTKRPNTKKVIAILPDIDWAADGFFEPNVSLVIVEHDTECYVYSEQLAQFQAELFAAFPERSFRMLVNQRSRHIGAEAAPRTGSFEIRLAQNARCEPETVWSGLQRGPPRRLKFPRSNAQLWPQVRRIVSRSYKQPDNDADADVTGDRDVGDRV